MKVAIAVTNSMITQHFGHCEYFLIHDISDQQVVATQIVANPPHERGFLPQYLQKQGVDVVIAGNIGEMAVKMFTDLGIEVFRGISGTAAEVIDNYVNGRLNASDIVCREHLHHHHD